MSILQDIYDSGYCPRRPIETMPQALKDSKWAFYGEIEKTMGADFIERHWDALCEVESFRDYDNFREGFRLGVSLMLELL